MGTTNTKEKAPRKILPHENPYPGHAVKYKFVYIQVATCPSFDAYYPLLRRTCALGYRLMAFFQLPNSLKEDAKLPFQGIFCYHPEMKRGFDLHVGHATITTEMKRGFDLQVGQATITTDNAALTMDTSAIYRTIAQYTNTGGRLLSVGVKGPTSTQKVVKRDLEVDLFFEVPNSQVSQEYLYQCTTVDINLKNVYKHGIFDTSHFHHDWNMTLTSFLTQGWKLVDIILDLYADSSRPSSIRSMWVFEKAIDNYGVNRTLYESRIVENDVTVVHGVNADTVDYKLEKLMDQNGNDGWELASIVQTPTKRQAGWKSKVKVLFFFQRRLTGVEQLGKPSTYEAVRLSSVFPTIPEDFIPNEKLPNSNDTNFKSQYTQQLEVDTNQNRLTKHSLHYHDTDIHTPWSHDTSGNRDIHTPWSHGQLSPDSGSQTSQMRHNSPPNHNFKYPVFGPDTIVYTADKKSPRRSHQSSIHSNSSVHERKPSSSGSTHRYPSFGSETVEYAASRRSSAVVQPYRGRSYSGSVHGSLQHLHRSGHTSEMTGREMLLIRRVRRNRPATFSL